MSGLLGLLGLGAGAISAQNAGVAVSGRNTANVNTEGYSQERVDMSSVLGVPLVGGVLASDPQRYADDLRWAQALVFVYPTWWSGQPAMLKGWIDRVWVAGVAWELPPGADMLKQLLTNVRRIVVVTNNG